jgi:hypothetical protein
LLQQQAQIERTQQRLDRLDAAYARAFASNQPVELVRALHLERFAVAESLAAARRALPDLVQAARADGVSEEILRPYRYAVQPAGAR